MNILFLSVSSKNIHKQPAPWTIKAYLEQNSAFRASVLECSVNDSAAFVAAKAYEFNPQILAVSVYIWNAEYVRKIISSLKQLNNRLIVVAGGPEISFGNSFNDFIGVDYIIKGAGEKAFCDLVTALNSGKKPPQIISGESMDFALLPSPYTDDFFSSFALEQIDNIKDRLIYYESARGCPFSCSYCLSSAFKCSFKLPVERVKAELSLLVSRGAKCIKFTDRTFNADKSRAAEILLFIRSLSTDCAFHFECAADLFDDTLFNIIESMPKARIQFEIGVQSTNEQTLKAVNRKTSTALVLQNIKKLISFNNCQIHVDLIAGLPHEDYLSFQKSFNDCFAANPHVLQLGFLKLLKGSPLRENHKVYGYKFCSFPPYEILENDFIAYSEINVLKEIEQTFDKFYNTRMFSNSVNFMCNKIYNGNAFSFFNHLTQYLKQNNYKSAVSLRTAYTALYEFMLTKTAKETADHYITLDSFTYTFGRELPHAIKPTRLHDKENALKAALNPAQDGYKIIHFPQDNTTRLFTFTQKDKITKQLKVEILVP